MVGAYCQGHCAKQINANWFYDERPALMFLALQCLDESDSLRRTTDLYNSRELQETGKFNAKRACSIIRKASLWCFSTQAESLFEIALQLAIHPIHADYHAGRILTNHQQRRRIASAEKRLMEAWRAVS